MAASVLLVHDDIASIAAVRRLLGREGHEVILATSASDAVSAFGHHLPSLIILAPGVEGHRGKVVLEELAHHPDAQAARLLLFGESLPGFEAAVVPLPLDGAILLQLVDEAMRGNTSAGAWRLKETPAHSLPVPPLPPPEHAPWHAKPPPEPPEGPPASDSGLLAQADWSIAALPPGERALHAIELGERASEVAEHVLEQARREMEAEVVADVEAMLAPAPDAELQRFEDDVRAEAARRRSLRGLGGTPRGMGPGEGEESSSNEASAVDAEWPNAPIAFEERSAKIRAAIARADSEQVDESARAKVLTLRQGAIRQQVELPEEAASSPESVAALEARWFDAAAPADAAGERWSERVPPGEVPAASFSSDAGPWTAEGAAAPSAAEASAPESNGWILEDVPRVGAESAAEEGAGRREVDRGATNERQLDASDWSAPVHAANPSEENAADSGAWTRDDEASRSSEEGAEATREEAHDAPVDLNHPSAQGHAADSNGRVSEEESAVDSSNWNAQGHAADSNGRVSEDAARGAAPVASEESPVASSRWDAQGPEASDAAHSAAEESPIAPEEEAAHLNSWDAQGPESHGAVHGTAEENAVDSSNWDAQGHESVEDAHSASESAVDPSEWMSGAARDESPVGSEEPHLSNWDAQGHESGDAAHGTREGVDSSNWSAQGHESLEDARTAAENVVDPGGWRSEATRDESPVASYEEAAHLSNWSAQGHESGDAAHGTGEGVDSSNWSAQGHESLEDARTAAENVVDPGGWVSEATRDESPVASDEDAAHLSNWEAHGHESRVAVHGAAEENTVDSSRWDAQGYEAGDTVHGAPENAVAPGGWTSGATLDESPVAGEEDAPQQSGWDAQAPAVRAATQSASEEGAVDSSGGSEERRAPLAVVLHPSEEGVPTSGAWTAEPESAGPPDHPLQPSSDRESGRTVEAMEELETSPDERPWGAGDNPLSDGGARLAYSSAVEPENTAGPGAEGSEHDEDQAHLSPATPSMDGEADDLAQQRDAHLGADVEAAGWEGEDGRFAQHGEGQGSRGQDAQASRQEESAPSSVASSAAWGEAVAAPRKEDVPTHDVASALPTNAWSEVSSEEEILLTADELPMPATDAEVDEAEVIWQAAEDPDDIHIPLVDPSDHESVVVELTPAAKAEPPRAAGNRPPASVELPALDELSPRERALRDEVQAAKALAESLARREAELLASREQAMREAERASAAAAAALAEHESQLALALHRARLASEHAGKLAQQAVSQREAELEAAHARRERDTLARREELVAQARQHAEQTIQQAAEKLARRETKLEAAHQQAKRDAEEAARLAAERLALRESEVHTAEYQARREAERASQLAEQADAQREAERAARLLAEARATEALAHQEAEATARAQAEAREAAARAEVEALSRSVVQAQLPLSIPGRPALRVPLTGAVDLAQLSALVLNIALGRAELQLELKVEDAVRTLWFRRGAVIAAHSSHPREGLLDRARRDGLIDTRQENELSSLRAGPAFRLLELLRGRGFLRDAEAIPLVQRHTEQIAMDALSDVGAQYRISFEAPADHVTVAASPHSTPRLLADALRRAVDLDGALERLGGLSALPSLLGSPLDVRELGFSDKERRLLGEVDGASSLGGLLQQSGLRQEAALKTLEVARLLGLLETRPGAAPAAAAPALDVRRLEAKFEEVQEADYFAILGLPRGAGGDDVQRAFRTLTAEFDPLKFAGHPDAAIHHRAQRVLAMLEEAATALQDDQLRGQYARNLLD